MSTPSFVSIFGSGGSQPGGSPAPGPAGDAQKLLDARETLRLAAPDLEAQERAAKTDWVKNNLNTLASSAAVPFASLASSYNDLTTKLQSLESQKKAVNALKDEIEGHLGGLISQYGQAIEPVLIKKRDELQAALDALKQDESEKRKKLEKPLDILNQEIDHLQARLAAQASAEGGKKSRG